MSKSLAIFFDTTINYDDIKHIYDMYDDYFFITDNISLNNIQHNAIIHYTEIRMRGFDVLITNTADIDKVYGFDNKLLYLYIKNFKIHTMNYEKFQNSISKLDKIIYLNHDDEKLIKSILNFNGDYVCYTRT